ncbi:MAG: hypothetical protein ABSG99_02795 [Sedimentisphaerales bacterium]
MLTVNEIQARLKVRYCLPHYVYMTEVRSATGFVRDVTYADGLAISLYPSKDYDIHGFEIKVNRSDVLKELKSLRKSENIQKFCSRWWLVVGDKSIVDIAEIPPYWGLLVPYGSGLRQAKVAPLQKAEIITPDFLASLIQRMYLASPNKVALNAEYERGVEAGKAESISSEQRYQIEQAEGLKEQIEKFEQISGIEITNYNGHSMGEAVKFVQDAERIGNTIRQLKSTVEEHQRVVNAAQSAIKNLQKL